MRKLASIRADLGLNQEEMAKLLEISYPSYQLKEQGKSPLLARELKKIYLISKVPMDQIEIPC